MDKACDSCGDLIGSNSVTWHTINDADREYHFDCFEALIDGLKHPKRARANLYNDAFARILAGANKRQVIRNFLEANGGSAESFHAAMYYRRTNA